MQRKDVDRMDWKAAWYALDADARALLDRAGKAEAERDAAFAAGQEEMRQRAADECGHHLSTFDDVVLSEDIEERIRALPIKPRP